MRKNRILLISLLCLTMFFFAGCGAVGLDNDDDKTPSYEISTGDGGKIDVGEDLKWPTADMGNLSEPKAKITGIIKDESTGACTIAFTDMPAEDASNYVEALKALGYSGGMDSIDSNGLMFMGTDASGVSVTFTYDNTSKDGAIVYIAVGSAAG